MKGPRHFIPPSLHFWGHFIPKGKIVTSYQSLHTKSLHTKRYFIPVTSYQSHFMPRPLHTKATSYQSLYTECHFISKPLHTKVTSYQSLYTSELHTRITSYQSLHIEFNFIPKSLQNSYFMQATLYHSLNLSTLLTEFTRVIVS